MARLPYLTVDDLAEEHRHLLARDIHLNRLLVHNPEGAKAFWRLGGWIRNDQALDGRLRELAILQVGWQARSAYEWSHHVKLGLEFGCTEDDIAAIGAHSRGETTHFSELDRAVLDAAVQIADQMEVDDHTWEVLGRHLSDEELMDLVFAATTYCMVVRLLATLRIDVEDEYQPYLDQFPLPS